MIYKTLIAALFVGIVFTAGLTTGERLTLENELHTECFKVEDVGDGSLHGEPVHCTTGAALAGEGVYVSEPYLYHYEVLLEDGAIVAVSWTHQQAEQEDWITPAKIERVNRQ